VVCLFICLLHQQLYTAAPILKMAPTLAKMTTAITTTAIPVASKQQQEPSQCLNPPRSNTNDSNSSILTTSTFEAIPASTVEVRTCSSSAPVLATAAVTAYHHNHNANDDKKFGMCCHCHRQLRSNALTKYAIASRLISSGMVTGQQWSHGTRFLFLDGAPDIHSCHHK